MTRFMEPETAVELYQTDKDVVSPAYRSLQDREGIPVHEGLYVENVNTVETGPWDRTGQHGAFVNLLGAEGLADLHVHDLEPGGETDTLLHLYDETVYVAEGHGATIIEKGDEEVSFEWGEGALFSLPQQIPYRFTNLSDGNVRLISQTSLPALMFVVRDFDLIFDPPARLPEELDDDYYSTESAIVHEEGEGRLMWEANFIPDLKKFSELQKRTSRGPERARMRFTFSSTYLSSHVTELPVETYLQSHRHGPGAHVMILSGEGYSIMWPEAGEKIRVDWKPGTVLVPPTLWYHQHFNLSPDHSRFFAWHGLEKFNRDLGIGEVTFPHAAHNKITYPEEDPAIREEYEAELEARGLSSRMPEECYVDPDFEFDV